MKKIETYQVYCIYSTTQYIYKHTPQGVTQGGRPHKKLHTVLQNGYIPGTEQKLYLIYQITVNKRRSKKSNKITKIKEIALVAGEQK